MYVSVLWPFLCPAPRVETNTEDGLQRPLAALPPGLAFAGDLFQSGPRSVQARARPLQWAGHAGPDLGQRSGPLSCHARTIMRRCTAVCHAFRKPAHSHRPAPRTHALRSCAHARARSGKKPQHASTTLHWCTGLDTVKRDRTNLKKKKRTDVKATLPDSACQGLCATRVRGRSVHGDAAA